MVGNVKAAGTVTATRANKKSTAGGAVHWGERAAWIEDGAGSALVEAGLRRRYWGGRIGLFETARPSIEPGGEFFIVNGCQGWAGEILEGFDDDARRAGRVFETFHDNARRAGRFLKVSMTTPDGLDGFLKVSMTTPDGLDGFLKVSMTTPDALAGF